MQPFVFDEESGPFTAEAAKKFLTESAAGTYKSYRKSQPIPESNNDAVKTAVYKNWEQIVNDQSKDVLVEFYAPWCQHCAALAPIYESVAESQKANSTVVLAKYDLTANHQPDLPSGIQIEGFPTIILFPRGDKSKVRVYEGDRTEEDIHKFIRGEPTADPAMGEEIDPEDVLDEYPGDPADLEEDEDGVFDDEEDEEEGDYEDEDEDEDADEEDEDEDDEEEEDEELTDEEIERLLNEDYDEDEDADEEEDDEEDEDEDDEEDEDEDEEDEDDYEEEDEDEDEEGDEDEDIDAEALGLDEEPTLEPPPIFASLNSKRVHLGGKKIEDKEDL